MVDPMNPNLEILGKAVEDPFGTAVCNFAARPEIH